MLGRSRIGMMAALAAAGALAVSHAPRVVVTGPTPDPTESSAKVSRQRKRWLERQARKQMRAHKKTRR